MREKLLTPIALAALLASPGARAQTPPAQPEGDIVVRGAFVTTRPGAKKPEKRETPAAATPAPTPAAKTAPANGKAGSTAQSAARSPRSARRGAPKVGAARPQVGTGGPSATAPAATADAGKPAKEAAAPATPAGIGIGYTLFMRDPAGEAVRVSPKREFRSGDAIRVLLEANTDGYLYIFNAENDGQPQMIFPNAKLERGANAVRAHVPYEIPSAKSADETLRWFVFNDTPAVERLYVVVTRAPLPNVPAGEELVRLCAEQPSCAWAPPAAEWAALKRASAGEQIAVSQAKDDGRAQTVAERDAATRGIGLSAEAPLPSVIYMITSSNANVLVATVDLIHK